MMSRLKGREKNILLAAAALLALFILDKQLVRGRAGAGDSLGRLVAREEASLSRELRLIARRGEIMELHKRLLHGKKDIPAQDEATAMLSDVETLARKHRISLQDMKPGRAANPGESSSLSIQAEGGWESLSAFLLAIDDSPALLQVEKVTLRLKGKEPGLLETQLLIRRRGESSPKQSSM